ncbi:hypothetical protein QIH87_50185 (plasmid) [Bradyrhizobium elkanii]|uniref:LexA family protein n=1 Tax=Bradyrhizobium elkanii TaxID=29448 RepID=UPI002714AF4F|nr:hypothetical protein [Bradyrhizobium elkanii]WLA80340.1 hypothetical protein QNJ99_33885 [Bradyrhizobium elkanii]WLB14802.1 hypothetical protein QIH87_50185 [Bradyrhizobium elkanii]WLB69108.1 hypothetical protein QIH89_27735 [Bradyrhizobium elkanii]
MTALMPRQRDCLNFIRGTIAASGMSPTYEEIMDALGLRSKSGVHRLVTGLEERGAIRRIPGLKRTLKLVGAEDESDALAFLDPYSRHLLARFAGRKKMTSHAALAEICRRFFSERSAA